MDRKGLDRKFHTFFLFESVLAWKMRCIFILVFMPMPGSLTARHVTFEKCYTSPAVKIKLLYVHAGKSYIYYKLNKRGPARLSILHKKH